MIFDVQHATNLVVWLVFVFWEPFNVKSSYKHYREHYRHRLPLFLQVPPFVFAPVWTFLNVARVAFIFLFMSGIPNVMYRLSLPVFILFVVGELLQKTWTLLFFKLKMTWSALTVGILLWAIAVTHAFLVGFNDQIESDAFRWTCVSLMIVYALWLAYANLITLAWGRHEMRDEWKRGYKGFLDAEAPVSDVEAVVSRHGFKKTT